MAFLPSYRLKLYRNFKSIDTADYHGIVRYYERFEDAIYTLDTEEFFDCALTYTNALFETGNFGKHLVMCDHLLELVIMQNIQTWGGEDIFASLLFKKAASLFKQGEFDQAAYILRELIKLHPGDARPVLFLRKCLIQQKPGWLIRSRAAAMGLAFLAALAIALELFVMRPFFLDYYEKALIVHNVLFGACLLVLTGGEVWHFHKCHREAASFARRMQERVKDENNKKHMHNTPGNG